TTAPATGVPANTPAVAGGGPAVYPAQPANAAAGAPVAPVQPVQPVAGGSPVIRPADVNIPAGTSLAIRVNEHISVKTTPAGAGTAAAGLTGNRDLDIPAESLLRFKLADDLTLRPS